MKKIWIVVLVVAGVLVIAGLGTVGVALAKGDGPFGMGSHHGQMADGEEGPLHDYMIDAFADAVGLTPEALETRLDDGESIYDIAIAQGIAEEQVLTVLIDARSKAVEAALADGVITQEQAEWMKSHGFEQGGYGRGDGTGMDCDGSGMGGRGRGNGRNNP